MDTSTGSSSPPGLDVPDSTCPDCGGRQYVRTVVPGMMVTITVREKGEAFGRQVAVPYEHDVVCACVTRPTVPTAQACGLGEHAQRTLATFDPSELDERDWHRVAAWVSHLPGSITESRGALGFVFYGHYGAGKTHLAAALAHAARQRALSPRFVREVDLVEGLKASYDDGAPEREETILARLSAVQLLVLDDLGASYVPRGSGDAGEASTWYSERLYQIIDRRTAAQRPLIVTSNLSKARLRERLGPATVSRLEGLQWIWFGGRDRR
jgi:hypothetical protein